MQRYCACGMLAATNEACIASHEKKDHLTRRQGSAPSQEAVDMLPASKMRLNKRKLKHECWRIEEKEAMLHCKIYSRGMAARVARFIHHLKKTRLATRAEILPPHKFKKVVPTAYKFLNKNKIKQITVKARRQAEDTRRMGTEGSPGGGQRDGGKLVTMVWEAPV